MTPVAYDQLKDGMKIAYEMPDGKVYGPVKVKEDRGKMYFVGEHGVLQPVERFSQPLFDVSDGKCTLCTGCLPPGEVCRACGRGDERILAEELKRTRLAEAIYQAFGEQPASMQRF